MSMVGESERIKEVAKRCKISLSAWLTKVYRHAPARRRMLLLHMFLAGQIMFPWAGSNTRKSCGFKMIQANHHLKQLAACVTASIKVDTNDRLTNHKSDQDAIAAAGSIDVHVPSVTFKWRWKSNPPDSMLFL